MPRIMSVALMGDRNVKKFFMAEHARGLSKAKQSGLFVENTVPDRDVLLRLSNIASSPMMLGAPMSVAASLRSKDVVLVVCDRSNKESLDHAAKCLDACKLAEKTAVIVGYLPKGCEEGATKEDIAGMAAESGVSYMAVDAVADCLQSVVDSVDPTATVEEKEEKGGAPSMGGGG